MITLSASDTAKRVQSLLKHVAVLPRRLVLETAGDQAEVPRLRGVWGAALHGLDSKAYDEVFHPPDSGLPKYILRPAGQSPLHAPKLDFILLGSGTKYDEPSLRAWDIASGMGLGKQPDRHPFVVRRRAVLDAFGRETKRQSAWPLSAAVWPLHSDPETTPCRIQFVTPVALNRDGRLIEQPTLKDIVAKGCRRLGLLLPTAAREDWDEAKEELIDWSRSVAIVCSYGEPVGLSRYSASQNRDFPVPCVPGRIDLPAGPGPLWPLLAALQWTHVGKSTNVGLGQLRIEIAE